MKPYATGNSGFHHALSLEQNSFLKGAEYWINTTNPNGRLPFPRILSADYEFRYPYQLMTKMEGHELGSVYSTLNAQEKRGIASSLYDVLQKVQGIPEADGYGYLTSYEDKDGKSAWKSVVVESIKRSERRLAENQLGKRIDFAGMYEIADSYESYFAAVRPSAFLHDATTKNVLISNGSLSGIVDLDEMCFGDKLYLVGLIQLALMCDHHDTDYVCFLKALLRVTEQEELAIRFYTLIFAIDFISEYGMRFNRNEPMEVDKTRLYRLHSIYTKLFSEQSARLV